MQNQIWSKMRASVLLIALVTSLLVIPIPGSNAACPGIGATVNKPEWDSINWTDICSPPDTFNYTLVIKGGLMFRVFTSQTANGSLGVSVQQYYGSVAEKSTAEAANAAASTVKSAAAAEASTAQQIARDATFIASFMAAAKLEAQKSADSTPGIERCSRWSANGQSGQECAFTALSSGQTLPVSKASDTPTEKVTGSTSSKVELKETGVTAISVEGTVKQLATLIPKVVETVTEQKSLQKILSKIDKIRPVTYSKVQALPIEQVVTETLVSLTLDICTVDGTQLRSLKPGKCIFTYQLVGKSNNSFTIQKEIIFKK